MTNFTDSFRTKIENIINKFEDLEKRKHNDIKIEDIREIKNNLKKFLIEFSKSITYKNYIFKFESDCTIESFAKSVSYFDTHYSSNINNSIIKSDISDFRIHSSRLADFKSIDSRPISITKTYLIFTEFWIFCGVLASIFGVIIIKIFNFNNSDISFDSSVLIIGLLVIAFLASFILLFFLNKKHSNLTKLELLQHLINNPNPHLKSHDKMLDFLLHELKDDKQSDTVLGDFQKYIKSK